MSIFRLLSTILSLLALTPLLCGQHRSRVEQAWDLAGKGRADEAIRLLNQVVRDEPKNADAQLLLGSLLMEKGDRNGAIEHLTAGAGLQPRSAVAQNALGEGYLRFDEVQSARPCFEKAIAINPGLAVAQVNLSEVLLKLTQYSAAAPHLEKAIRIYGNNSEAAYPHYLLAKVYSSANNPAQAAKELEQAVKLNPELAEAWADLGQARKLLMDDEGALAAEKRAVDLRPADAIAQYRLGVEYLHRQLAKLAVAHLEEAARLDPADQSTLNSLQMALRQDGRAEEAAAIKQKLADLLLAKDRTDQNSVLAIKLNNDGAELEKAGNLAAALQKYSEASRLYPAHPGIRVNYAVALLRLGHWTEGLTQLNQALKQSPDDIKIRAALKDALSQAPAGTVPPELR